MAFAARDGRTDGRAFAGVVVGVLYSGGVGGLHATSIESSVVVQVVVTMSKASVKFNVHLQLDCR